MDRGSCVYASISASAVSFIWDCVSGGQASAMLVKTVSQKACPVVAGVRDLDSGMDPQRGDLIEIFRPFYKHWAVYVGSGYVVHLTSADGVVRDSLASSNTKKALVKIDRLLDACAGDQWRVNNKYDNSRPPKNVEEIVRTALSCVGEEISYNVLLRNCEHFATFLRYDEPASEQAILWGIFGTLTAVTGLLMGLVRN